MEHTWEQSKENTAPIATGRQISTILASRPFGTTHHDDDGAKIQKYEKLVKRSERAAEWLFEQANRLRQNNHLDDPNDELSQEQIDRLHDRLRSELGYNTSTSVESTHIDFDPLKYWILYIKHIRDTRPSDTQRQFLLMERCARTFLSAPFLHVKYANDVRLIRTCILYADKTSSPQKVFQRMNALKVGQRVSLFWVAWAWVAEKNGDYVFCEKIFRKACRVGAEPKGFLVEREKQFLRRMSRHWLNTSRVGEEVSEEEDGGRRGVLRGLEGREDGRVVNRMGEDAIAGFPRRSDGGGSGNNNKGNVAPLSTAGFSIFQDENSPDPNGLEGENRGGFSQLTKESEMTKENKMRAERWNERGYGLNPPAGAGDTGVDSIVSSRGLGGGASFAVSAPAPAFDVFVDEEFEDNEEKRQVVEKSKIDDRSLRQRLDGGTADRIRKDPLRYMNNPSKIASDQEKYEPGSAAKREEAEPKKQLDVKEDPRQKAKSGGYNKELLIDSSGQECCFEERRAMARYFKLAPLRSDFNLLKLPVEPEDVNTSLMDTEESIEEVDMEDIQTCTTQRLKSALKPPSKANDLNTSVVANPRRVLFGANTEFPKINESLNASAASSQPNDSFVHDREETINTKFANAEISMMFCSPNNNESMAEHQGRSFMTSTCKKPLFSTNRKKNVDSEPPEAAVGTSFAIFQDDCADEKSDQKLSGPSSSFAIFQDEATDQNVDNSTLFTNTKHIAVAKKDDDETATLSGINELLNGDVNFQIHSDSPPKTRQTFSRSENSKKPKPEHGDDATASLSDIGALLGNIESCSIQETKGPPKGFAVFSDDENAASAGFTIHDENASASPAKKSSAGFEIFSDEDTAFSQKKRRIDEPNFGDISRIDGFQIHDENEASANIVDAIDYQTKHKSDMESAMRECMKAASKSNCELELYDYRNKSIPRELLRKSFSSGFTIDLFGGRKANIIHELGRGVNGVVLLINNGAESGDEQNDALKIQAPIGSLAHEFSLLLQLEERVDLDSSGFYPFPQPQALYAFSEGGLFVMTACSNSGMTLLDVVNTSVKSIGSVPELLAIYYTSRMLRHLECLHRDGKILHCDVKPDNWVLTMSSKGAGAGSIAGADLMLVDFGRAIDLERIVNATSNALFTGSAAAEDMECKAMRQGLPWGVDLDLYGLCASSHILLFGSHMEVVQEKATGNLKLKKLIRRYWQRDLWRNYFETLLNYDTSNPDMNCLRDLRITFDEYLADNALIRDLESRISTLYNHLPKKR